MALQALKLVLTVALAVSLLDGTLILPALHLGGDSQVHSNCCCAAGSCACTGACCGPVSSPSTADSPTFKNCQAPASLNKMTTALVSILPSGFFLTTNLLEMIVFDVTVLPSCGFMTPADEPPRPFLQTESVFTKNEFIRRT